MADEAEGVENVEDQEEDMDDQQQAFLHFSKYAEARRALPWDQWTFREKASYYMDRIFLGILAIFFIVLMGEVCYKVWYLTNPKKIAEFVTDSVVFLFDLLFSQEKQEELIEL